MELYLVWDDIKKNIKNEENTQRVYEIFRELEGDEAYFDQDGNNITPGKKEAREQLKAIGEGHLGSYV